MGDSVWEWETILFGFQHSFGRLDLGHSLYVCNIEGTNETTVLRQVTGDGDTRDNSFGDIGDRVTGDHDPFGTMPIRDIG